MVGYAVCKVCTLLWSCAGFTTRAHIVRAMLEAICFQTREVLDAMRADADMAGMKLLRADGGATQNSLLMQLQVSIAHGPAGVWCVCACAFVDEEGRLCGCWCCTQRLAKHVSTCLAL